MRALRALGVAGLCCLATVGRALAADGAASSGGFWSLFDQSRLPFIPVPEIDVDPNSGTTIGVIPTWVSTDEHEVVRRIVAPDVIYNPNFGYGARGRIFGFPSPDVQWSIVGGGKERVEREFAAVYESGRLRTRAWSMTLQAIYDRSGTPRFYGFGNHSAAIDETDYTKQQQYFQLRFGRNLTPHWQLAYTVRARTVDVTPGSLARIASIEKRFGMLLGSGVTDEILNRYSITYDNRDDPTVPRRGIQIVAYTGEASRHGVFNASLYSEAGLNARGYWPVDGATTLAAHLALRYMPSTHHTPFWALSSIGGDASDIDGSQPLRGFGDSRFFDHHSFSASCELRHRVYAFDAVATHIDIELTPFADVGRVFGHAGSSPLAQLHVVGGLGVRAVAGPTVVGYVDFGYGSEGLAVFTGINYPI